MGESVARSFLGTRGYLAPEMLQRVAYDKSIDVWALGIVVFVLLCGCLPFDDDSAKVTESDARKKFTLRYSLILLPCHNIPSFTLLGLITYRSKIYAKSCSHPVMHHVSVVIIFLFLRPI